MEKIKNFRPLLKPLLGGIGLFVFVFFLLMVAYVLVGYWQYVAAYQETQQLELKTIQQKTKTVFDNLKELLRLTKSRIATSSGDALRIQNILSSAPRLYLPHEIPKIQGLSYYKLSSPQKLISRVGIFPLDHEKPPTSSSAGTITFHEDTILSEFSVMDEDRNVEGVLELQVNFSDFKAILGEVRTVSFEPVLSQSIGEDPLQKEPFPLYAKKPPDVGEFMFLEKGYYAALLLCSLTFLLLLIVSAIYIHQHIKKSYGGRVENLEENLLKLTSKEAKLEKALLVSEQKRKNHRISCKSRKKIHESLSIRQREQAQSIFKSLQVIERALTNSKAKFSLDHQLKIIRAGLRLTELMSNGLISKAEGESINFKNLFEEVEHLCAERIYKSSITLEVTYSDDLVFYGDALFITLILMNVVGRAIHRAPRNKTVSITVTRKTKNIHLQLRGEGFSLRDSSEKIIKNSFDFLIPNDIFQIMCQEGGLKYKYFKNKEGFNTTEIIIPIAPKENLESNIIQLFT